MRGPGTVGYLIQLCQVTPKEVKMLKKAGDRILEGRKAEYAVMSALVADQVAAVCAPEYAGLFGTIARFLIGA